MAQSSPSCRRREVVGAQAQAHASQAQVQAQASPASPFAMGEVDGDMERDGGADRGAARDEAQGQRRHAGEGRDGWLRCLCTTTVIFFEAGEMDLPRRASQPPRGKGHDKLFFTEAVQMPASVS